MKALKNLFLNELTEMYDCEPRLNQALLNMIDAATCEKLKQVLEDHLVETEDQVEQLEKVFAAFEEAPRASKCPAMIGLLEEGDRIVTANKNSPAINAAIISACQKIEHYEIATYGTLRAWAQLLGNEEAADLLDAILDQEKDADQALNDLSIAKNRESLAEVEVGHAEGHLSHR